MSPSVSSWSNVLCTNPAVTPGARLGHTCTVYKECLYVFGGWNRSKCLNDFYEFRFTDKAWRAIAATDSAPSPRCHHVAFVYKDSLYVFAGHDDSTPLIDLTKYDFITKQWSNVEVRDGTPPVGGPHLSAVAYGTSLYCFGGSGYTDLHEYKLKTNTWARIEITGVAPEPRNNSSLVVFNDSCILFGGHDGSNFVNDAHVFNFAQRSWTTLMPKGPVPTPRSHHAAVVHVNAMYVFGGRSDERMNDIHKLTLTPESCEWEAVAIDGTPARARSHHAAAIYKSKLIAFGGRGETNKCHRDFIQLNVGKHQSSLISNLRSLVNNQMMSDITFVVEGVPIYAHKCLCLRCDYFQAMFNGEMRESREPEVVINAVRHTIFLLFMEFLYTDELSDVSIGDAMELLAVADQNVATILYAADLHGAITLRGQCVSFVLKNFAKVIKTLAFAEMSRKNVELNLELLQAH